MTHEEMRVGMIMDAKLSHPSFCICEPRCRNLEVIGKVRDLKILMKFDFDWNIMKGTRTC